MILVLSIQLFFAICLKVFPPKKPNDLYGYQLGSSKKSLEHWKVANKYVSSYLIILCSLAIILSLISENQKFNGRIAVLTIYISGLILTYFVVEKRLKKIESATSANCG